MCITAHISPLATILMRKTIFISSTYFDLISYRKIIWDLLQCYNLTITGMEKFGARSERPIKTCLAEVEKSDIFLGIIGMRYGSVENLSGKSYTQLEYEKAKVLGKQIFVFLMDENKASIHPCHVDGENYLKLKDFKSELTSNHTVVYFHDENHLVQSVNETLKQNLDSSELIRNFRPTVLEAKVERVVIGDEKWLVIIGFNNGTPYELYAGNEKRFFKIPDYVTEGQIKLDTYNGERFDFRFIDKEGYHTTAEGLERLNFSLISQLVLRLLTKEIPVETVIGVLNELYSYENEKEVIVIKVLSKILEKQVSNRGLNKEAVSGNMKDISTF